jgi:predicted ribosomally synthesized peptide with SipW-like signal peptide
MAAVLISILAVTLAWWYFRTNVAGPVTAGYGLYIGGACALAALVSSVWALAATLLS